MADQLKRAFRKLSPRRKSSATDEDRDGSSSGTSRSKSRIRNFFSKRKDSATSEKKPRDTNPDNPSQSQDDRPPSGFRATMRKLKPGSSRQKTKARNTETSGKKAESGSGSSRSPGDETSSASKPEPKPKDKKVKGKKGFFKFGGSDDGGGGGSDDNSALEDTDKSEEVGDIEDGETAGAVIENLVQSQGDTYRIAETDKKQKFQVRVHVVEARQLMQTDANPACKVYIGERVRHTRTRHATINPKWDHSLHFEISSTLADLCYKTIEFRVYSIQKMKSDAFLGSHVCDLGVIYRLPSHCLSNKWLVMTWGDDDDEIQGYLKVWVCIVGMGDRAPVYSPGNPEIDDTDGNVLFPSEVRYRTVNLACRIYLGQDISVEKGTVVKRMLRKYKARKEKNILPEDLVNPYVEVSVSGYKIKTKTEMFHSNPCFFQELRFPLNWPPIGDEITLRIYDFHAVGKNEPIGTCILPMSSISRPGMDGFLPTLGPSFLTFYGSVDKRANIRRKGNLGKTSPTSFKGRVLVEIHTNAEETSESAELELEVFDLNTETTGKVKHHSRLQRQTLYANFISASMISDSFARCSIRFQISIGFYGDKRVGYNEKVPVISETETVRPIYDGSYHYFMPWTNRKPCCAIPCQFEKQWWRFEASNFFENIAENFGKALCQIESLVGREEDCKVASKILLELDKAILQLTHEVPFPKYDSFDYGQVTDLDSHLYQFRKLRKVELIRNAYRMRDQRITVQDAILLLRRFYDQLINLSIDPQLKGIPDVFIWMVCDGKPVAFQQIKTQYLHFSKFDVYRGKYCGRVIPLFMKLPGRVTKSERNRIMALVHIQMWFGYEGYGRTWDHFLSGGEMTYYAESYENQRNFMGKWKETTDKPYPFSNETGDLPASMQTMVPLPRFEWKSPWFVDPSYNTWFDEYEGYDRYTEQVYEQQTRSEYGIWDDISVKWTDEDGMEIEGTNTIELPNGWEWLEKWRVERSGPVDDEGFEYSVQRSMGHSSSVEHSYHMFRRRLWVRERGIPGGAAKSHLEQKLLDKEGWVYSSGINKQFRTQPGMVDRFRRRRWHRRMIRSDRAAEDETTAEDNGFEKLATRVERIESGLEDPEKGVLRPGFLLPRIYISYKNVHAWQLRGYIFQGRDLFPQENNGLSDPFVRLIFNSQCKETMIIKHSVNPVWDQTLILSRSYLAGLPERLKANPISAVLEVYNHESIGEQNFLGRVVVEPMIRADPDNQQLPKESPKLRWYPLQFDSGNRGEILASFELYQCDNFGYLPESPPLAEDTPDSKDRIYTIPPGIRPVYEWVWVEFLCWGVRNLRKFQLTKVKSPLIELQLGRFKQRTEKIKSVDLNPNFTDPILAFKTQMPKDLYFMTPITLCLYDVRSFGRQPLIGTCIINEFNQYLKETPTSFHQERPTIPETVANKSKKESDKKSDSSNSLKTGEGQVELDWWSNYYTANEEVDKGKGFIEKGYLPLELFKTPLEEVKLYKNFEDFADTFHFRPLKKGRASDVRHEETIGELKGRLHIYKNPTPELESQQFHSFNFQFLKPEPCLVRVYVIRAIGLASPNRRGTADPYVLVKCGQQKLSGREKYIGKTLDPLFGQVYELEATIPQEKDLNIRIRDRSIISVDDDIGQTTIDLENRLLTLWRSTCGFPKQYIPKGYNCWRDQQRPTEILRSYCAVHKLPSPNFPKPDEITLGTLKFNLTQFESSAESSLDFVGPAQERLALHILNNLKLVPEHVETRSLFSKKSKGMEMGKIQLWVDLFPKSLGEIPPAVDISPRKPKSYELRLIVYRLRHTVKENKSMGEYVSDLYVKAFIQGLHKKAVKTDVHYGSTDGSGNFNWRLIIKFDYLASEQAVVVKGRDKFWHLTKSEDKFKPELIVQVWDNSKLKKDRFIGQYTFDLLDFEEPQNDYEKMDNVIERITNPIPFYRKICCCCCCCAAKNEEEQKIIRYYKQTTDENNLCVFYNTQKRGWWPMIRKNNEGGFLEVTSKLDMHYELWDPEEASQPENLAGPGRSKPNQNPELEKPDRPLLDRFWLTSRMKGLCRFVCRHKRSILCCLLISSAIGLLVYFIYRAPGIFLQAAVDKNPSVEVDKVVAKN